MKTYSDRQLHRLADRHRPHGDMPQLSTPERAISAALRTIAEPARRHRCDLCLDIFECHLCQIDKDHPLHSGSRDQVWTPARVCEACIHQHELWVVIVRFPNYERGRIHGGDRDVSYYDHLSGERIRDSKSQLPRRYHSVYNGLTHNGETHSLQGWADKIGMDYEALRYRVKIWTLDRALTEPLHKDQSKKAKLAQRKRRTAA